MHLIRLARRATGQVEVGLALAGQLDQGSDADPVGRAAVVVFPPRGGCFRIVDIGSLGAPGLERRAPAVAAAACGEERHADPVPIGPALGLVADRIGIGGIGDRVRERQQVGGVCGASRRRRRDAGRGRLQACLRDGPVEQVDGVVEMNLAVGLVRDDPGEAGLALAVPGSGPAQRMHQRHGCRIAADEQRGQSPGLLQPGVLAVLPRRLAQPPVEVHLLLHLAGLGVGPGSAAGDGDRGGTEEALEHGAGLCRPDVALDAQRQPVGEVGLLG